jgi:2-aminoethylphosphonate transport system ATP-binding protein
MASIWSLPARAAPCVSPRAETQGESAEIGRVARIDLRGVSVRYGASVALHPIDLEIADGEVVVLLGPSGSGKTTLLRAIAGFSRPSSGSILLGERDVTFAPPHARDLGMVVQNYALFPHLRVAENVAFGLRARKRPRHEIEQAVQRFLGMVGMGAYAQRYPRELSGGQQQRVAIARALAIRPRVLLLDEPLSALDAPLRSEMLEEIRRLHAMLPDMSIVYVTHDQSEAISLAHRILLMREGRIAAQGTPRDLHETPPNRYAAEFFGQSNLLPVTMIEALAACCPPAGLDPENHVAVQLAQQIVWTRRTSAVPSNGPALLCIRPHDLRVDDGLGSMNCIAARVESVQWLGATQRLVASFGALSIRVDHPGSLAAPKTGDTVKLTFDPQRAVLLADAS